MDQIAIKIGGILSVLLGIGHCLFYRGFGWKKDFKQTRLLTAKVLYTIHVFLIPMFLFFGYVSLFHTKELAGGSQLGFSMTVFYSVFWFFRAIWQIFYFKPSQTESVKKLLPLHYFLIVYFILLWAAYTAPVLFR